MTAWPDLATLAKALDQGRATAVSLAYEALTRIAAYDRAGPILNAVPILSMASPIPPRAATRCEACRSMPARPPSPG